MRQACLLSRSLSRQARQRMTYQSATSPHGTTAISSHCAARSGVRHSPAWRLDVATRRHTAALTCQLMRLSRRGAEKRWCMRFFQAPSRPPLCFFVRSYPAAPRGCVWFEDDFKDDAKRDVGSIVVIRRIGWQADRRETLASWAQRYGDGVTLYGILPHRLAKGRRPHALSAWPSP